MASVEPREHVSSLDLDRLEMGALEPEATRRARAHLMACHVCREQHRELVAARSEFSERVFDRSIERVLSRSEAALPKSRRRLWFALPLAAAAALSLLLFRPQLFLGDDSRPGVVQPKGHERFVLMARHNGKVFAVSEEERTLAPGDELRFVVPDVDPHNPYLLVASIDAAGKANVYFPPKGERSQYLGQGRWESPGAVTLDEVLGPERVFALFSKEPLEAGHVQFLLSRIEPDQIRTVEKLLLPGVEQQSVFIEKALDASP
jgi:hypothetical protein